MIVVEVLDLQAGNYKATAQKIARRLMKQTLSGNFYLEIYLVGDTFMRKNVLAFPHPRGFPRPDLKEIPLGEIYVNPKYISEHNENFTFMLIHGFLHLLGYDHVKKDDRIAMEREETRLLRAMPTF